MPQTPRMPRTPRFPHKKSGFVLGCQQVLALGTVLAISLPAASVVDINILAPGTEGEVPVGSAARPTGSLVAVAPVDPTVTEKPVRGVAPQGLQALAHSPRARRTAADNLAALSAPEPVEGYATVGVTWRRGEVEDDSDITVSVRSLDDGAWSEWEKFEYHQEHAPEPESREGRSARPGTDAVVVGDVDEVQVKAVTKSGAAPAGMKLAVIDPGQTLGQTRQAPEIDTAQLSSARVALAGSPALVTPKPKIFSRRQWGANERLRNKSSLRYGEVHAGFVHHTVNSNGYTAAQVPALLRGIYAYHTKSLGWSDIGYNYLVDRFGRIWEGRYGGVSRPVVGAHTLGYNDYAFAMSALGNFDTKQPSAAMIDAYGRVMAWKLSLHGVDPGSTKQKVGPTTFRAINGHRDAGQTACPGRYLYSRLSAIRTLADQYQKPFSTRAKRANISGPLWPDLVARHALTKRVSMLRVDGGLGFSPRTTAAQDWKGMDLITAARDLTGDGRVDMVARTGTAKGTAVYPGDGAGGFGAPIAATMRFAALDQMTGAWDMTGDDRADLIGRVADTKRLYLYPGRGDGTFGAASLLSSDWSGYNLTTAVSDMSGDGNRDIVARDNAGILWLWRGDGAGNLVSRVALPGAWGGYDLIAGLGDVTNDGESDIVARSRTSKLTFIFPGDLRGGLRHYVGPFDDFKDVSFFAVAGSAKGRYGDIVARGGGGNLVVFQNSGGMGVRRVIDTGRSFPSANLILNVGDWNGDRRGDVMTRSGSGEMWFYAGDGLGHLASPVLAGKGWKSVRLIAAVGDITGDGYPDLMGQPRGGSMRIYTGNGAVGFRSNFVAHSAIAGNLQIGVGLWNSDGSPDTVVRRKDGSLVLYPGNGPGGLRGGVRMGLLAARYDWIHGVGDADGDGDRDLIARERSTGDLWLLPKAGPGFGLRQFVGEDLSRFDLSG